MTAAVLLAQLRALGADLMVQDGQVYARGLDCTLDRFVDDIELFGADLVGLLEKEAAVRAAYVAINSGRAGRLPDATS